VSAREESCELLTYDIRWQQHDVTSRGRQQQSHQGKWSSTDLQQEVKELYTGGNRTQ